MDKDHHSSTNTQQKLSPMVMTYWRIEKDYKSIKEGGKTAIEFIFLLAFWFWSADFLIKILDVKFEFLFSGLNSQNILKGIPKCREYQ